MLKTDVNAVVLKLNTYTATLQSSNQIPPDSQKEVFLLLLNFALKNEFIEIESLLT